MALTVLKFGGSSLAGKERLHHAAQRIIHAHEGGNRVIAVLSARGDTTDRLLRAAQEELGTLPPRESDLLLSVGEQLAVAALAAVLRGLGQPVTALTGWQAGILTDSRFGDAQILEVRGGRILSALDRGEIVLVTGFQGVTEDGEITTLGRGGSDTTAVALAAFLNADVCRILTDVDGVYTADPRIVPQARRLAAVSYDDMLELSRLGAKVLHTRCVELAREHGLVFEVCSSLQTSPGTVIRADAPQELSGISVMRWDSGSAVSLIGRDCLREEPRFRTLLAPFHPHRITRGARSLTAILAGTEAADAARLLHGSLFPEKAFAFPEKNS